MSDKVAPPFGFPMPPGYTPPVQLPQPRHPEGLPVSEVHPLGRDGLPIMIPEMPSMEGLEAEQIMKTTLHRHNLSDPQVIQFIASYLVCRNAHQAGAEVGLDKRASTLLRNKPDVHACIAALTAKSLMRHGIDAGELVQKVKDVSDYDPADAERPDGSFKHLQDMTPELRRAIKKFKAKNFFETDANGIKVVRGEIIEIEFYDRIEATKLLGREADLFKETRKVEHDVTGNMKDVLLGAGMAAQRRLEQMPGRVHETILIEAKKVEETKDETIVRDVESNGATADGGNAERAAGEWPTLEVPTIQSPELRSGEE